MPNGIFFVLQGWCLQRYETSQGNSILYTILGQADAIGLTEALSAEPAPYDVSTGSDVEGLFLSRDSLEFLQGEQVFWREAYGFLARAHNRLLDRLAVQATLPLEGRIAHFLLETASVLEQTPVPRLTQGLIAQGIGASRPKVNRVLQHFRELALVDLENGRVVAVVDPVGLRQFLD